MLESEDKKRDLITTSRVACGPEIKHETLPIP